MQEIDKLYEKVNVIPNRLEKFIAFTINKNLVFINTMQFIYSNLNKLVKNLTDNDYKYLSEEFSADLLELVKQKGVYPNNYMVSFENILGDKLPDRCDFFASLKNKSISEKYYSHTLDV